MANQWRIDPTHVSSKKKEIKRLQLESQTSIEKEPKNRKVSFCFLFQEEAKKGSRMMYLLMGSVVDLGVLWWDAETLRWIVAFVWVSILSGKKKWRRIRSWRHGVREGWQRCSGRV